MSRHMKKENYLFSMLKLDLLSNFKHLINGATIAHVIRLVTDTH